MTTGAESDIEQATRIARQMVGRWGMSETLGPVTLLPSDGPPETSPRSRWLLDQEVQRIIEEAHATVRTLLTDNRERLESLTRALLAAETLDAADAYGAADVATRAVRPAPAVTAGGGGAQARHETNCWPPSMSYVAPVTAVLIIR